MMAIIAYIRYVQYGIYLIFSSLNERILAVKFYLFVFSAFYSKNYFSQWPRDMQFGQ